jgi:hypothetical protein
VIRFLLFLLLAGALAGYAFWVYTRAELPVPSGRRLAGLRAATLLVLLTLIFDPILPWRGGGLSDARWVLLDVSASMGAGDEQAWTQAADRAAALQADGWTVVAFGDGVSPVEVASARPDAAHSALGPALLRAAEAGVSEAHVVSDLRFEDPVDVASVLSTTGLNTTFVGVGAELTNAGIASFAVSDQSRRGDPVTAEVELFAEGVADSLLLEVREEDRLVLARAVAPPLAGRRGRWEFDLPAPVGEGRQRYTAYVRVSGDAYADDDLAVSYMMAGHDEGGLVVVSLRPDWEARALLPVLAEATGLPAAGYLRVGPDRFAPMGRAVDRRPPVDSATVRRAAGDAALLVVHGLDARTDAWGRRLPARAGRIVAWPLDAAGGDAAGVRVGSPQQGEWYAATEVPASALAGDLAGARLQDLPPLTALLPMNAREGASAPLLLQLRGVGPGQPALVLRESGGDRRVAVLAAGFWRWAARDGDGRDAYRRLWSGVAGWLLASDLRTAAPEVRPEQWVFSRNQTVRWWIPGPADDSVRIQVFADSTVLRDTVVATASTAATGTLPPGLYTYRATSGSVEAGAGRFDVTPRTDELLAQALVPEAPETSSSPLAAGAGGGHPLRTEAWPYLLLLTLLSLEWIGRRRAGLR